MRRNVRARKDCLFSHVALGNYIIHNFNDEMHMRRARKDCLFSHVALGNYIIHNFNDEMHMRRNVCNAPSANMNITWVVESLFIYNSRGFPRETPLLNNTYKRTRSEFNKSSARTTTESLAKLLRT